MISLAYYISHLTLFMIEIYELHTCMYEQVVNQKWCGCPETDSRIITDWSYGLLQTLSRLNHNPIIYATRPGIPAQITPYVTKILPMDFQHKGPVIQIQYHDDVIKWKHFPRYWPFVWGIHRLPVNSPHKGQWRGTLMFSLICTWINDWVNNGEACDLRGHRANYDIIIMMVTLLCNVL